MRERVFVARRDSTWTDLEGVLAKADARGARAFAPAELRELAFLYRATTGDLAAAQSRAYSPELRAYLNRLTARAHAYVYASTARNGFSALVRFLGETYPREFRRSGAIITAITAITVVCAVVAYVVTMREPNAVYGLLGADSVPVITKSIHDSNFAVGATNAPAMSSEIITNNIRVAGVAFAGGATLGIVTLQAIVENGIMVGALGALFTLKGFGPDFWATIAPHGVIELLAIQVAGAAGILIAKSVLAPGRLRRADALRLGARRAGVLMLGVMAMLLVAGTIEGFFTPRRTPIAARASVGITTAIALIAYFSLAGRPRGVRRVTGALAP